jgi:hypothetical protein
MNKQMYLDLRYNDFFYVQATGRIKKNVTLVKMVYQKKAHLTGWMEKGQFDYNVNAGQYMPPKNGTWLN